MITCPVSSRLGTPSWILFYDHFFTGVSVRLVYVSAMGLALFCQVARKGNDFCQTYLLAYNDSSVIVGLTWRFLLGRELALSTILSLLWDIPPGQMADR